MKKTPRCLCHLLLPEVRGAGRESKLPGESKAKVTGCGKEKRKEAMDWEKG